MYFDLNFACVLDKTVGKRRAIVVIIRLAAQGLVPRCFRRFLRVSSPRAVAAEGQFAPVTVQMDRPEKEKTKLSAVSKLKRELASYILCWCVFFLDRAGKRRRILLGQELLSVSNVDVGKRSSQSHSYSSRPGDRSGGHDSVGQRGVNGVYSEGPRCSFCGQPTL